MSAFHTIRFPGFAGESGPIPLPAATILPSESKATRAALSFRGIRKRWRIVPRATSQRMTVPS